MVGFCVSLIINKLVKSVLLVMNKINKFLKINFSYYYLQESFRSTSGVTNTMSSSDFVQSSQAFTKKEIVDIKVSGIPKNTKVVKNMHLQFSNIFFP
jgi:hypothetical protein